MAKQYLVLIGDIVHSRNVNDRNAVQRKFSSACARLNVEAEQLSLASPLTITLGDEFQAVFKNSARLWECILRLEAVMAPLEIRFAVGVGAISTPLKSDSAMGMDGPAFYAARAAMEQLKKMGGRYRIAGLADNEVFINAVLDLLGRNRMKWRASRVLILASLLQGKNASEISKLTKTSEQAVYRNIRDGALGTIFNLLTGITERINNVMK